MSPKVMETWINETLQDAEHLDIPGAVMKAESKNPIKRYGIHREFLEYEAGLSADCVNRLY